MKFLPGLLAAGLFIGWLQPEAVGSTHRLTKDEEKLFKIIKNNGLQKRKVMKLDPILCKVARARAQDMGKRKYFAHVNPSGQGPNFLVTKAGYRLPSFYDSVRSANNIESIAARSPTGKPRDALKQWLNSPPHRSHTMALTTFSQEQVRIGVGIAQFKNAPFATYYVFISAPPNENPKPPKVKLVNAKGRVISRTR
jgi:Uncharacterized protein with SCP/PR1 domains